ncbi:MAG: NAD-dependent epimerase [Chthonomonadaceae bacterium]|nr:NAD-dependent epimerase [Chthonomonadaceae bacterium]
MTKTIVTGVAGFIGYHLTKRLLERGDNVFGLDNLNDYYDVFLKEARLAQLKAFPNFQFRKLDIADTEAVNCAFEDFSPRKVVNLAAQAGVRYSLTHPHAYVTANLQGFVNVLEGCKTHQIEHLVYASSSSVYGSNIKMPLSIHDAVDHPVSLYAASKKANELIAHSYSHLYRLPTTGLRFFTVYGPWSRPDMALQLFTKAILEERPIDVFNYGKMSRDFTYVGDIVEGVIRTLDRPAQPNPNFDAMNPDPGSSSAPYRVYNIGNSEPVQLNRFIEALEECLGKTAIKNYLPLQPGDVPATHADVSDLERETGFRPSTPIEVGIAQYVAWYREYYRV